MTTIKRHPEELRIAKMCKDSLEPKTIKEIEKEIEKFKLVVDKLRKELTQCSWCGSMKKPTNLEYYEESLLVMETKLQTKKEDLEIIEERIRTYEKVKYNETGYPQARIKLVELKELKQKLEGKQEGGE